MTAMILQGMRASKGVHEGPARVCATPADIPSLSEGDVMVVRETSPDWIEAFERLRVKGAIVTETGGMLCHAAIVCREYRIPCVVGVKGATTALRGTSVRVDGAAGTVEVLP
jgi:pyruvate,water dikinase